MEEKGRSYEINKGDNDREPFSLGSWVWLFDLAVLIGVFALMTINFHSMPTPVMRYDITDNTGVFLEGRSKEMLTEFEAIGQKVVGSAQNEIEAVAFITLELDKIISNQNPVHDIEYTVTTHTGAFYLDYKPYGSVNVYSDLQNIAVKLKPRDRDPEATLLINSHYDTVPVSTGAGDAGLMVVVMLETLRILSQTTEPFKHNIVFLFNGGEEIGLKAAHAFITQHDWRHNITALLNLDSSGVGGKEVLFQAGPDAPWLANIYAKNAPYPYASAMGEELFQANLVPSDTDFRIFRDFGGLKGLDLAYIYNGYFYHTKLDTQKYIPDGTYQHTGSNVLALVKYMANSEDLNIDADNDEDHTVFFDYNSWFMITYTRTSSIIMNVLIGVFLIFVMILSIRSMCKKSDVKLIDGLQEWIVVFLINLLSIVLGAGLSIVMAVIYDACGRSLSFYANQWMLFGLYFAPFLLGFAVGPVVFFNRYKNRMLLDHHYELQLWCHAQALLHVVVLIILTIIGIRSAFIILIPVVFYCFTAILNFVLKFQHKPMWWITTMSLGQVFPFLFFCHLSLMAFHTFIPMSARGGPAGNPDFLICAFSIGMAYLMGSYAIPFCGVYRRNKWVLGGFVVIILATIILIATPVGFPYKTEVAPQRHWIFHSKRMFYEYDTGNLKKSDSGFFLLPMDRHSTPEYLMDDMPIMEKAVNIKEECINELFCGMPFYSSRMHRQSNYSYWIPASDPILNSEVILQKIDNPTQENFMQFTLQGPDTMGIFISPEPGVDIVSWSFLDHIPIAGPEWQGRPTYFISYNAGKYNAGLSFWLNLRVPDNWTGKKIVLAIGAQYTHYDSQRTQDFQDFIDSYPEWTHVTAWMNSYSGFEF